MLTLARATPDPCAPSVLHVFNLRSHEVAVVSTLYLEATYVNELLTKSLDLVLISLSDPMWSDGYCNRAHCVRHLDSCWKFDIP